ICTDTSWPPMSMVVLPLRYQPSEPVENSLTSAWSGTLLMATVTGLALARKSARLIGQVVFLAMRILLGRTNKRTTAGPVSGAAASYHGPRRRGQERSPQTPGFPGPPQNRQIPPPEGI